MPRPPVLGEDRDVCPVVPVPIRVVVAALVLTGDPGDGVLGMIEVEVEIDPRPHADRTAVGDSDEVPLGKDLGIGEDVLLGEEVIGVGHREAGELDPLQLLRHPRLEVDDCDPAQSWNDSQGL